MPNTQSLVDLVLDDVVEGILVGRSVLVQAAHQGHEEVLRYLMHRISNSSHLAPFPNQRELRDALSAAFLAAAQQGHPHCLSALLERRADFPNIDSLNARNGRGETALMVAAKNDRGGCVETLLQHNPEAQVAATDKEGRTALMLAAEAGHADRVRQLLQYIPGTQVAAVDQYGNTALILAARGGHAECMKQLLRHIPGTQVAAACNYGHTALIWAACKGHAECVDLLLQHTPETQVAAATADGDTALILAAFWGHAQCIRQLLQHSPEAQVAAIGEYGNTALVAAVSMNHPVCVALLLAHSPSAQMNGGGRAVVEVAARLGHPQCLHLLLAHDPQPQQLDAAWLSALRQWGATHARTSPRTQCLEQLHAKGALLPFSAQEADRAKNRLFIQDFGSRALVADRANEAVKGLAISFRVKKRKAEQGE